MPLTARDVNIQRGTPHHDDGTGTSPLRYTPDRFHSNDENSQALRGVNYKTSSSSPPPLCTPSPRLLAPTKASAAKTSTSSFGRNTPLSHSRLPLRALTPGIAPPISKWSTRVAGRTMLSEKSDPSLQSASRSEQLRENERTSTQSSSPMDKPLPPRPIATFANSLSPSKDSRGLIDAIETPLTISVHGNRVDWPTLTPSSPNSLSSAMEVSKQTVEKPCEETSPVVSTVSRVEKLPDVSVSTSVPESHTDSQRSSPTSFVSAVNANAEERLAPGEKTFTYESHESDVSTDNSSTASTPEIKDKLARTASLRSRISNGSIVTPSTMSRTTGFTDFTRSEKAHMESRQHSPSPASFSRLRRSKKAVTGASKDINTVSSPLKTQKTASRIPIPDSKKATLVDIKSRVSSTSSATPSKSDSIPTFGNRRIDSPGPLQILDQGMKRRQLRRADTNASANTTVSSSTQKKGSLEIEQNTDSLQKDNQESRPSEKDGSTQRLIGEPTVENQSTTFYRAEPVSYYKISNKSLDGPPSTSPFTGPLQTIPSQSVLPLESFNNKLARNLSPRQTEFPVYAKRLSDLFAAHSVHTHSYNSGSDPAPDDTRSSLVEILKQYEREDNRLSKEGFAGLQDEHKKHITRTLTLLEGKGSPPKTEVDNETLLAMFGHLRRGLEKAPKTASLVENAAAAEMFLAQSDETNSEASISSNALEKDETLDAPADQTVAESQRSEAQNHQTRNTVMVTSKWSYSTPSDKANSPTAEDISPTLLRRTEAPQAPIQVPPKSLLRPPVRSIGFPNISEAPSNTTVKLQEESEPYMPEPIPRAPSAAAEARRPGSVKAARQTMYQDRGGFARTTATVESKKTSKLPTSNTKTFSFTSENPRGRTATSERPSYKVDVSSTPVAPRSRSKSRFMLDKINGLFSGRRDKHPSAIPPVPRINGKYIAETQNSPPGTIQKPNISASKLSSSSRVPHSNRSNEREMVKAFEDVSPPLCHQPSSVDHEKDDDDVERVKQFSTSLEKRAEAETSVHRKERLLSFAKALRKSVISAKEAEISAEVAKEAALRAALMYQMAQQSVTMLARLASSLSPSPRKH